MAISRVSRLAYADWPAEDRRLWEEASRETDFFDEGGPISRLSLKKRKALISYYAAFLTFVAAHYPERLSLQPGARVDRALIIDYVQNFLGEYPASAQAPFLDHLRYVLVAFSPDIDWSWLREIANRIRARGKRKPKKRVSSDLLYSLGIQLMDDAEAEIGVSSTVRRHQITAYRDGLMIALLALVPIRCGTLVRLRIGKQLLKSGELWVLDIPAEDTKTRVALEYDLFPRVSERINTYLRKFRSCCPGADSDSLWLSIRGRPLGANQILALFKQRTSAAFGFPVSPHQFRHAAGTFMAERDPANVRAAKDLLGHASFAMTEKHYIMAQTRLAGRALADAIDGAVSGQGKPRARTRRGRKIRKS